MIIDFLVDRNDLFISKIYFCLLVIKGGVRGSEVRNSQWAGGGPLVSCSSSVQSWRRITGSLILWVSNSYILDRPERKYHPLFFSWLPERAGVECSNTDIHWTQITKYKYHSGKMSFNSFCPVFEPDMDEKNKVEYKKIHDDYKNLV